MDERWRIVFIFLRMVLVRRIIICFGVSGFRVGLLGCAPDRDLGGYAPVQAVSTVEKFGTPKRE
jgi:hypothetical protein